ncbi:ectoine hydroxylase EctD (plasmid) [Cupriavidus necator N-1]|uniref:Ectoine hydroxylase EctD n=1 Tax=Cupriavidus necator (strain ATCC 43291 / DSM 13513 / CCUG 52238 / LMG 8453 / N-1) TaxID=1042878 RepID=F8GY14_CUPNN|nr:phytanoyl-CoA dioxygenase family protein [Cupriavidus necator]AEI83138.1 ectoine hydroxylase EctD [Cupriavidus necator N-1]MDX6008546.1 phytanoyl-CoA dioxygenase family protein [Cupriavidus necator]
MLTEEQIKFYDENGFLVLRDVFTPEELRALQQDAVVLRSDKRGHPDANVLEKDGETVRAAWAVELDSEACARAYRLPRVLGAIKQLLGETYLHQSRLNYKAAGKGDIFQWHQDYASWIHDGVPHGGHRDMLTVLITLDDSTPDNGPLRFIPGSHKHGLIEPFYDTTTTSYPLHIVPDEYMEKHFSQSPIYECVFPAGTMVFFCGNLVHSSKENHSNDGRRNLYFAYSRDGNRPTGAATRKHKNNYIMNPSPFTLQEVDDDSLARYAAGVVAA